jgi:hypothetical protein
VLVGTYGYDTPVMTLRRAVQDAAATPTLLADLRVPLWWLLADGALGELAASVPPGGVVGEIKRALYAAVASCAELDGVSITATTGPLPRKVARYVDSGRFDRLVLVARPRDWRVVRRVTRRIGGRLPADVYWL